VSDSTVLELSLLEGPLPFSPTSDTNHRPQAVTCASDRPTTIQDSHYTLLKFDLLTRDSQNSEKHYLYQFVLKDMIKDVMNSQVKRWRRRV
jgi:hypothetical protein